MASNPALKASVDAVTGYVNQTSTDLDAISTMVSTLNDTITTLQNSQGQVDAADQASIDSLVAQGKALQDKADAAAGRTIPPPPVVTGGGQ